MHGIKLQTVNCWIGYKYTTIMVFKVRIAAKNHETESEKKIDFHFMFMNGKANLLT